MPNNAIDTSKIFFNTAKEALNYAQNLEAGKCIHLSNRYHYNKELVLGLKAGRKISFALSMEETTLKELVALVNPGVHIVLTNLRNEYTCEIIDECAHDDVVFEVYRKDGGAQVMFNSEKSRNGKRVFFSEALQHYYKFQVKSSSKQLKKVIIPTDELPREIQPPIRTQLMHAIIHDNVMMLRHLILQGLSPNQELSTQGEKLTPIIELAIAYNAKEVCKELLNTGINVNDPRFNDNPLLHQAIKSKHIDIAKLLIESGDTVYKVDKHGLSALYYAFENLDIPACDLLWKYKAVFLARKDASAQEVAKQIFIKVFEDPSELAHNLVKKSLIHHPVSIGSFLRFSFISNHPGITKLHILSDISEQELEKIPNHIKTIVYNRKLSFSMVEKLRARKITMIYDDINMFIDPKYLDGRIPNNPSSSALSITNNNPLNPPIFFQDSKVVEYFPQLAHFNIGQDEAFSLDRNSNAPSFFLPAANKTIINPDSTVYAVFAYRKLAACLPDVTQNDSHCMIVLTVDEFNSLNLKKDSPLIQNYDFLILYPRCKPQSETPVQIEKLIERRRAAADYAKTIGLKYLYMLDDNVASVGCQPLPEADDCIAAHLKQFMERTQEPFVSVSTSSNLLKNIKAKQLGAKFWIMDIEKISQALPGECFLALFPQNETLWGEDYYLQILLHILFQNEANNVHGYKIIDQEIMQLQRLSSHRSTNSKKGMKVQTYQQDDVLGIQTREHIQLHHPNIWQKIEAARVLFNDIVCRQKEDYLSRRRFHESVNLDLRRDQWINKQLLRFITDESLPIEEQLPQLLNNEHALYVQDGQLYYVNKQYDHHQLLSNSDCDAYQYFYAHLTHTASQPRQLEEEATLLARLVNSSPIQTPNEHLAFPKKMVLILEKLLSRDGLSLNAYGQTFSFRSHQVDAFNWLKEQLNLSNTNKFIFNMATSSGKTSIMLLLGLIALKAEPAKNVCIIFPTIQLVHQTLKKLYNDYRPLMTCLGFSEREIYGVCSKESSEDEHQSIIKVWDMNHNRSLQNQGHLYLFCNASFKEVDNDWLKENMPLVIIDESHKQQTINAHFSSETLQCFFSATPQSRLAGDASMFSYTRKQGIDDGILTPLMVDDSLPDDTNNEDVLYCLQQHQHPNGQALIHHKGIIYVQSIKEAETLHNHFSNSSLFNDDTLFIFTSNESQNEIELIRFTKAQKGVAIAVNMLVEGYDDDVVDYVMVLKQSLANDNLHQIIGRILRLNLPHNPDKIGYAMIKSCYKNSIHQEASYYPPHLQSQMTEHCRLPSVQQTILANRTFESRPAKRQRLSDNPMRFFPYASGDDFVSEPQTITPTPEEIEAVFNQRSLSPMFQRYSDDEDLEDHNWGMDFNG